MPCAPVGTFFALHYCSLGRKIQLTRHESSKVDNQIAVALILMGSSSMTIISLRSDKPMKKDSSCINICTCAQYLKSVLAEIPFGRLFHEITENRKFFVTDESTGKLISVTHDYLLEPGNWISNDRRSGCHLQSRQKYL
jgi:hypothetical protein